MPAVACQCGEWKVHRACDLAASVRCPFRPHLPLLKLTEWPSAHHFHGSVILGSRLVLTLVPVLSHSLGLLQRKSREYTRSASSAIFRASACVVKPELEISRQTWIKHNTMRSRTTGRRWKIEMESGSVGILFHQHAWCVLSAPLTRRKLTSRRKQIDWWCP